MKTQPFRGHAPALLAVPFRRVFSRPAFTRGSLALLAAGATAAGVLTISACDSGGAMAPIKPIGQTPPVRGEPYIGLLKSGLVAIGGETTGWSLTLDEPVKLPTGVSAAALEVDVSRVIESARAFDGRRVRAQGTVVNRRFVERGEVPVLSISDLRLSE